jgi:hypothetical protein
MNFFRETFFNLIKEIVSKVFGKPLKIVLENLVQTDEVSDQHISKLYFGNFMIPDAYPKDYDEVWY